MARRILLVSPIPSHPQDQGNSARIHTVGRMLQSAGFLVHFLYWTMEGLQPRQRRDMEQCWDDLHVVPCTPRDMSPTGQDGVYRLDDWYDPKVTELARDLHRRWHFCAVLANYVWFCGVLEGLPGDVVKILDTHDVFGGRDLRMRAAGLKPEWYYTTPAEEAAGLARADIVLAIQDEEAEQFRKLGHRNVQVIGHILGRRFRHQRQGTGGQITVGYLGSGNPLNLRSFEQMQQKLAGAGHGHVKGLVAGSICGKLGRDIAPFESIGRIEHTDSFYDSVDLVVNPMTIGTGLKIKSVEAVFEGMPLLATLSAMVGLPSHHPLHRLASPEDLADCLSNSRFSTADLHRLAGASRACAREYAATVNASLRALAQAMGGQPGAIRVAEP